MPVGGDALSAKVTEARLEALAAEIRGCIKQTALDILRAGQRLIEARIILEGGFDAWVEAECDISERTARNFMGIARRFQERPEIVAAVPATALYSLASDRVSDQVIDLIADKALQGERMKVREVRALIEAECPAPKRHGGRKSVEQHITEAAAAVTSEIQDSGAVSVGGVSVPVTSQHVQAAITEQAAEGVKADGEVLRQQLEREQGLSSPAVRSKAIVDHVSPDGRVTFMSLEMAQKLKAHQRVYCLIYIQEEPQKLS